MTSSWFPHHRFHAGALLLALALVAAGRAQTSNVQAQIQFDQSQAQALSAATTAPAQTCTQSADFCIRPSFDLIDDPIQIAGLTKCHAPAAAFSTIPLFAGCINLATGQLIPGATIKLTAQAEDLTGGHLHLGDGSASDNPIPRPAGPAGRPNPLNPDSGVVGSDNTLHFTYTAPDLSGIVDITVNGTLQDGTPCFPVTAKVGIELPGLSAIPLSGPGYTTTRSTGHDSNNVFVNPSTSVNLQQMPVLFDQVATELQLQGQILSIDPIPTLTYLSLSLPFGGLFDVDDNNSGRIHNPWHPPHCAHRRGMEADLRIRNVGPEFRGALIWSIIVQGFTIPVRAESPSNPTATHWHLTSH